MTNISNEIQNLFDDEAIHRMDDIVCQIKAMDQSVNDDTVKRTIRRLRKNKFMYKLGRDVYVKGHKDVYQPKVSKTLKTISNYIHNDYPDIDVLLWDTADLKYFSHNYFAIEYKIVEVERGFEETIFEHLRDKFTNVFLNPSDKEYEKYILSSDCIVVKSKALRAPKMKVRNVDMPKLEKIIVDIIVENSAFSWLQGKELERLTTNLVESYEIDLSTLFNYAETRNKESYIIKSFARFFNDHLSSDSTIRFIKCLNKEFEQANLDTFSFTYFLDKAWKKNSCELFSNEKL